MVIFVFTVHFWSFFTVLVVFCAFLVVFSAVFCIFWLVWFSFGSVLVNIVCGFSDLCLCGGIFSVFSHDCGPGVGFKL